jgi:hypothetical protein
LLNDKFCCESKMMRSPVGRTRNNYFPPAVIDGIIVKRGWKEAGGKPKVKEFIIVHYDGFKYVKCPSGYVLLCVEPSCKNLAISDNFKCLTHNKGEETYTFCRNENCISRSSFGFEDKKPLYCKTHKSANMIDVVSKRCELCELCPSFSFPEEIIRRRCKTHILDGMVDKSNKKCEMCITVATFGFVEQSAVRCKTHILDGMVNVHSKQCEKCDKIPTFGFEGERALRCKTHILDGMVDVRNNKCEECNITANFGFEGQKALRCKIHILDGMVNVHSKQCEKCSIQATFGFKGQEILRCKTHIVEGMVSNHTDLCEKCSKRSSFGFKGGKATHCKSHMLEKMIDVNNTKCGGVDCIKIPSYGKLYTNKRIHCKEHSLLNHYSRDKLKPVCQVINCQNLAYYVDPVDSNVYPIHCHIHHQSNDIELVNRICPDCDEEIYFPANKEICMNCGEYRIRKINRFKETMVKHFLTSNHIPFIHDRIISQSGSLFRPDFLIWSNFGVIIVEVDERQHKRESYNKDDEINRMCRICDDVQIVKPNSQVLFIRYNPDGYDGKVYSCKERQEYLYVIIMHFINMTSIEIPLAQLKLFYDGFIGNCEIQSLC